MRKITAATQTLDFTVCSRGGGGRKHVFQLYFCPFLRSSTQTNEILTTAILVNARSAPRTIMFRVSVQWRRDGDGSIQQIWNGCLGNVLRVHTIRCIMCIELCIGMLS